MTTLCSESLNFSIIGTVPVRVKFNGGIEELFSRFPSSDISFGVTPVKTSSLGLGAMVTFTRKGSSTFAETRAFMLSSPTSVEKPVEAPLTFTLSEYMKFVFSTIFEGPIIFTVDGTISTLFTK